MRVTQIKYFIHSFICRNSQWTYCRNCWASR